MKKCLAFILSLAVFSGCTPTETTDAPPTMAGAGVEMGIGRGDTEAPVAPPKDDLKDIGDAEQTIRIAATLAEKSKSPLIEEKLLTSNREEIMMCTLNVTPPPPAELWLQFSVTATNNFEVQPVVVRGRVFRDDEEIGAFSTYVGKYGGRIPPEGTVLPQSEFSLNVLEGLPQIPDTTLVHVEAQLSLMPVGTDETTLDPATATTDPQFTVTKRSNPVRINFTPAAQ